MEEETNHEGKEMKEEIGDEEKMEEEDGNEKKKLEKDPDDTAMEGDEGEEAEDTSLLEPDSGEEEEEGEVDTQQEEKLLGEDEVSQDYQEGMDSEEYLRNYVNSDFGNTTEHEYQSFLELNIESPKDPRSDDDDSSQILNSQANANDSDSCEISHESSYYSTKPNDGSTINYQDESYEHLHTSTITEQHGEEIILVEEEQEEEEGAEQEVLCVEEVRVEEKEQGGEESTREEGGGKGRGGYHMANTDQRPEFNEVKIEMM